MPDNPVNTPGRAKAKASKKGLIVNTTAAQASHSKHEHPTKGRRLPLESPTASTSMVTRRPSDERIENTRLNPNSRRGPQPNRFNAPRLSEAMTNDNWRSNRRTSGEPAQHQSDRPLRSAPIDQLQFPADAKEKGKARREDEEGTVDYEHGLERTAYRSSRPREVIPELVQYTMAESVDPTLCLSAPATKSEYSEAESGGEERSRKYSPSVFQPREKSHVRLDAMNPADREGYQRVLGWRDRDTEYEQGMGANLAASSSIAAVTPSKVDTQQGQAAAFPYAEIRAVKRNQKFNSRLNTIERNIHDQVSNLVTPQMPHMPQVPQTAGLPPEYLRREYMEQRERRIAPEHNAYDAIVDPAAQKESSDSRYSFLLARLNQASNRARRLTDGDLIQPDYSVLNQNKMKTGVKGAVDTNGNESNDSGISDAPTLLNVNPQATEFQAPSTVAQRHNSTASDTAEKTAINLEELQRRVAELEAQLTARMDSAGHGPTSDSGASQARANQSGTQNLGAAQHSQSPVDHQNPAAYQPPQGRVAMQPQQNRQVAMQPVQGHVAMQPLQGQIAMQPVQGHVAMQPVQGHVAMQPPQGQIAMQPPQGPVAMQHQGHVAVQHQGHVAMQPPQGQIAMQPPQGQIAMQPPQGQIAMQPPQGPVAMQHQGHVAVQHQGHVAMQPSQGQVAIQPSQGQVAIQHPQGPVAMQYQGHVAVQPSQGQVAMQPSQGQVAIQSSQGQVAIQHPQGPVAMQPSQGQVAIQSSQGQVAIQHPQGPVAMQPSQGQVAIQHPQNRPTGKRNRGGQSAQTQMGHPTQGNHSTQQVVPFPSHSLPMPQACAPPYNLPGMSPQGLAGNNAGCASHQPSQLATPNAYNGPATAMAPFATPNAYNGPATAMVPLVSPNAYNGPATAPPFIGHGATAPGAPPGSLAWVKETFGPKPVPKPKGPFAPGDGVQAMKQGEYEEWLEWLRTTDPEYARQAKLRQARRAWRQSTGGKVPFPDDQQSQQIQQSQRFQQTQQLYLSQQTQLNQQAPQLPGGNQQSQQLYLSQQTQPNQQAPQLPGGNQKSQQFPNGNPQYQPITVVSNDQHRSANGQLSGNNAQVPGQVPGNNGQSHGNNGQSHGNNGQFPGNNGQSHGNNGQTHGNNGQSHGNNGQFPGNNGQSHGNNGQFPGNNGQSNGNNGQFPGNNGQSNGKNGQTHGNNGKFPGNGQFSGNGQH